MSYYPPQTYGSIQPQYPNYANQNYYPTQYGSPATAHAGYPLQSIGQANVPTSPPDPHVAPELSAVTSELASHATRRLLSVELGAAGFDSAQPLALQRLELELVAFVEQLYERAHEYANLANRAGPIAKDLLMASDEYGLQPKELYQIANKSKVSMKGAWPSKRLYNLSILAEWLYKIRLV